MCVCVCVFFLLFIVIEGTWFHPLWTKRSMQCESSDASSRGKTLPLFSFIQHQSTSDWGKVIDAPFIPAWGG